MPVSLDAFEKVLACDDINIDLAHACLLIAQDAYPELHVERYLGDIERMAMRLRGLMPATSAPEERVAVLNQFLFEDLGFSGDDQDYYDPRNSYLNDVLDRRLGNPISLAVVQIELARRLGVPLQGVSFPGHFLVRLPLDEGIVVLDPFQKGRSLDAAELRSRARTHLDTHEIDDRRLARMLEPASHRAILSRMLRNLKAVYSDREEWDKALRCCDRLLTVDSHQPVEYRDRGRLYRTLGHHRAAREDLQRYLALVPQADDADSVGSELIELGADLPRLN
jgi:regulator of sirC expression with transglutaminase-like and TPR domain